MILRFAMAVKECGRRKSEKRAERNGTKRVVIRPRREEEEEEEEEDAVKDASGVGAAAMATEVCGSWRNSSHSGSQSSSELSTALGVRRFKRSLSGDKDYAALAGIKIKQRRESGEVAAVISVAEVKEGSSLDGAVVA
jgi:hypothetical protein